MQFSQHKTESTEAGNRYVLIHVPGWLTALKTKPEQDENVMKAPEILSIVAVSFVVYCLPWVSTQKPHYVAFTQSKTFLTYAEREPASMSMKNKTEQAEPRNIQGEVRIIK